MSGINNTSAVLGMLETSKQQINEGTKSSHACLYELSVLYVMEFEEKNIIQSMT